MFNTEFERILDDGFDDVFYFINAICCLWWRNFSFGFFLFFVSFFYIWLKWCVYIDCYRLAFAHVFCGKSVLFIKQIELVNS